MVQTPRIVLLTALIALTALSGCARYTYHETRPDGSTVDFTLTSTRKIGSVEAEVGEASVKAGDVDPGLNGDEIDSIVTGVVKVLGSGE